jgi:hypothetical protein
MPDIAVGFPENKPAHFDEEIACFNSNIRSKDFSFRVIVLDARGYWCNYRGGS